MLVMQEWRIEHGKNAAAVRRTEVNCARRVGNFRVDSRFHPLGINTEVSNPCIPFKEARTEAKQKPW